MKISGELSAHLQLGRSRGKRVRGLQVGHPLLRPHRPTFCPDLLLGASQVSFGYFSVTNLVLPKMTKSRKILSTVLFLLCV